MWLRGSVTYPDSSAQYSYDAVGNRLLRDGQAVQSLFDAANRLLEDEEFTYTYDANGNLTQKVDKTTAGTTAYIYDTENQLTRIDFPDAMIAEYAYDGLGRRIEKDVDGVVTRYVYDGEDIFLEFEFDGTNAFVSRYSHGDRVDQPLSLERAGQGDFFYGADHLGSIRLLTDDLGAVVNTYEYDS